MLTFVMWVIFIGVGICALVMGALVICAVISIVDVWRNRMSLKQPLPRHDRAAERMYDQQYFDRAVGNREK